MLEAEFPLDTAMSIIKTEEQSAFKIKELDVKNKM